MEGIKTVNGRLGILQEFRTKMRNEEDGVTFSHPVEEFGELVFTKQVMAQYLSESGLKAFEEWEKGAHISMELADEIANAMKQWAIAKGATHYTHWFQPLTGLTAEKHDGFFDFVDGKPISGFNGSELLQQEPDASSLPSGGLRSTFEARGYTAWDPTSPAFIYNNVLCIPSVYISYNGDALDYKAPLLKSIELINKAAVRVCSLFYRNVKEVKVTLGLEQEFFLIDERFFMERPDLVMTGRTLIGASPARGQQMEDHYFGSIPERVRLFLEDLEREAYRLGIPLKTRHNEVAPSQFEVAPLYEELNLSVDHNQLLMDLMDKIARKHHFRVLFHEKPFAGINGSGKHNNWSLMTNTGKNLFSPGTKPRDNLCFLSFLSCTLLAIYKYADLLRASIASAGNDLRLGANEAPPAIISVFLGEELTKILDEIEQNALKHQINPKTPMRLKITRLPVVFRDNTDRNRTSPFAFTGNKFEFRAVGASANTAAAMIVLNTIVAHQLNAFADEVEAKLKKNKPKDLAILETIRNYIIESKPIRYEGDGYSEEWREEAKRRGLPNITNTPEALDAYVSEKTIRLFTSYELFTERELKARHEIRLERYIKTVQIEARVLGELVHTYVIPAALQYQSQLATTALQLKQLGLSPETYQTHLHIIQEISDRVNRLRELTHQMVEKRKEINQIKDTREKAIRYYREVLSFFDPIRYECDKLEMLVSDSLWPLPKYREMLFLR